MFGILFLAALIRFTLSDPCSETLVNGAYGVPDSQITASSSLQKANEYTGPERGRLNTTASKSANGSISLGAWIPANNTIGEYLQVELNDYSLIRGVITQGENQLPGSKVGDEYVAVFEVETSMDGIHWTRVKDAHGKDKKFTGNQDGDTEVENQFPCPVFGKFIRVLPQAWSQKIALRFDVTGCQVNTNNTAPSTPLPQTHVVVTTKPSNPTTTTTKPTTTTTKSQPSHNQQTTTVVGQATTLPVAKTTLNSQHTKVPAATMATNLGQPGQCITDCTNLPNGDYQRCSPTNNKVCTKHGYIKCSNTIAYEMPCPPRLVWNDQAKYCDFYSPTCP